MKIMPEFKSCVIAVSFLNYLDSMGGMSKFMISQEQMLNEKSISFISIYSVKKMIRNRYFFQFFGLTIDGKNIGIFTLSGIQEYFSFLSANNYYFLELELHNILYFEFSELKKLIFIFDNIPVTMILHDYSTICLNFNLLKNGSEYCGSERISATKCGDCRYFQRSKIYDVEIRSLLNSLKDRLIIMAPSFLAKKIWLSSYRDYKEKVVVIPEQKFIGKYKGNKSVKKNEDKIKIAFLGNPSFHKGWDIFEQILNNSIYKSKYDFYVFNNSLEKAKGFTRINVSFTTNDINPMVKALRENEIDCVLLWSIWPETYSYTLYESISSNCYIITNKYSGNIANVVEENENGMVLNDVNELLNVLSNYSFLMDSIKSFKNSNYFGPLKLVHNDDYVNKIIKKNQSVKYKINKVNKKRLTKYIDQILIIFLKLFYSKK